jgi:hypothetical protein
MTYTFILYLRFIHKFGTNLGLCCRTFFLLMSKLRSCCNYHCQLTSLAAAFHSKVARHCYHFTLTKNVPIITGSSILMLCLTAGHLVWWTAFDWPTCKQNVKPLTTRKCFEYLKNTEVMFQSCCLAKRYSTTYKTVYKYLKKISRNMSVATVFVYDDMLT